MGNFIKTLYDNLENVTPPGSNIHMAKKPFPSIERFVLLIFPELNASDEALLKKCIKETRQQSDVIKDDFKQWEGMSFYTKLLEYYNPDYPNPNPQDMNFPLQKEVEKEALARLTEFVEDSIRRISGRKNVTQIPKQDMDACLEKINMCIHKSVDSTCMESYDAFFKHYNDAFHKSGQLTVENVTYHLYSYFRYAFTKQYPADALHMGITNFAEDIQSFMLRFMETTAVSYDDLYAVLYSMADPIKITADSPKQRPNCVVLGILIMLEYYKLDAPYVDAGVVIDTYFFYLRKLEQYNPSFPYTYLFRGLIQDAYVKKKKLNPLVKVAELDQLLSHGLEEYYVDTLNKLTIALSSGNGTASWLIASILEDPDVPEKAKEQYLGITSSRADKQEIKKNCLDLLHKTGSLHCHHFSVNRIAEEMIASGAPANEVLPILEKAIALGSTQAVITLGKIYAGMTHYDIHNQAIAESLFSRAFTMLQRENKLEAGFLILELYRKNPDTTIPISNMTIQNEYVLMSTLSNTLSRNYVEAYEISEKKRIDADIKLCNQLLDRIREKM